MKKYILLPALALIIFFMWYSFSAEGPGDLQGNYQQVAFARNENNTGPVQRVYVFTTTDTLWQEMITCGNMMPWTKYGTTTVWFFADGAAVPAEINWQPPHFPENFASGCLARYEKGNSGQPQLFRYPFGGPQ